MRVIRDPAKNESMIRSFVLYLARPLFYAVSAVKLVDVAAAIELLNKFCVDETLDFKLGHRGIALFHQPLHVVKTFHGGIRFSVRGAQQILVALLGKRRVRYF